MDICTRSVNGDVSGTQKPTHFMQLEMSPSPFGSPNRTQNGIGPAGLFWVPCKGHQKEPPPVCGGFETGFPCFDRSTHAVPESSPAFLFFFSSFFWRGVILTKWTALVLQEPMPPQLAAKVKGIDGKTQERSPACRFWWGYCGNSLPDFLVFKLFGKTILANQSLCLFRPTVP